LAATDSIHFGDISDHIFKFSPMRAKPEDLPRFHGNNERISTMTSAVIVSTARTPLAKSWKGAFNMTHGATLGGHAVQHAIARAGIDAGEVDDVIMGCATPEGATGANIARQIALRAGCPVTVSGTTVNRFCSSGLQTIALAAQRIIAGEATSSWPAAWRASPACSRR
jgi:3-oxoacyl-[acyl-carrier-protein] synthase III